MSLPPGSMSVASGRDLHSHLMLQASADFVKPEKRSAPSSGRFRPPRTRAGAGPFQAARETPRPAGGPAPQSADAVPLAVPPLMNCLIPSALRLYWSPFGEPGEVAEWLKATVC